MRDALRLRSHVSVSDCVRLRNTAARSAVLVALYSAAFFPLSSLPGAAAQFVSLIPIAVVASWLGMRGGLFVALLFIPLLAALSVVAQDQPWTYLLVEGRPAAVLSLVAMAGIAGYARDLSSRLDEQLGNRDVALSKADQQASDRSHIVSLGIELAQAHSLAEINSVVDSLIRRRIPVDRITITDIDRPARCAIVTHASGPAVPGFEVDDRFELDSEWLTSTEPFSPLVGDPGFETPSRVMDQWRAQGFRSVQTAPLMTRDGVAGHLTVSAYRPGLFHESDSQFLVSVAQSMGPHLSATALLNTSVRETGLRRAQSEVARAMSMSVGLDTLCEVAGAQLEALLTFDLGFIAEAKRDTNELTIKHRFGRRSAEIARDTVFAWDPDLAFPDDEVRFQDLGSLESGADLCPLTALASKGFQSVALGTLRIEGAPIGWLVLASAGQTLEDEYTSQLMQAVGWHISIAIIRDRAETEQGRLLRRLSAQNSELRAARTRLQESEEEVRKRNTELQRANEAKNTFLSAVSHELKTPLAIMIGYAELLGMNESGNLDDDQIDQLNAIERNGRNLDLMVSDLVDINRIESGRLAIDPQPIRPGEFIEEILAGLDSIAAEKRQRISRQVDVSNVLVKADGNRLGQVVTNLVTNACKYSPEGSEIDICARVEGAEFVVVVMDSGIGISEEDQEKLFTPFFRSSNEAATKQKGTGLGLVVSRSIVEMHNGTLQITSSLGLGTSATVRIPGVINDQEEEKSTNRTDQVVSKNVVEEAADAA